MGPPGTRPTAKSRSGFEPVFFYGNQQSQPPLMPSLALIGHLIDSVDGDRGEPIARAAVQRAAGWYEYLEGHARWIYATGHGSGARSCRAAGDEDCPRAAGEHVYGAGR